MTNSIELPASDYPARLFDAAALEPNVTHIATDVTAFIPLSVRGDKIA
jgi:hypothetical protein